MLNPFSYLDHDPIIVNKDILILSYAINGFEFCIKQEWNIIIFIYEMEKVKSNTK